ncbi:hypothetical protein DFP73DRAFT_567278 [Morchella snyderi]|nr:hypothetical protein DFP73DRAFT_567278 [Morchella snyderi]
MSPVNGEELRAQIVELSRQIVELQHIVHGGEEQRTPSLSAQRDRRFLVRGPNTVGRGVYLGLVRAGDVADLNEHALKELDDGLKTLALHFVPRGVGAPRGGTFGRGADDMIALLNRVSLRPDPMPGVAAEDYFSQFRNPLRGRYLRLGDARQGQFGRIPEAYQPHALYFETFLQLVLFRGIDLDALP